MKTKKLLSVLLALTMVVSMFATLTVTASAAKAYTLTYGSSEHGTFVVKVNNGTEIKDFNSGSMIDPNYSFTVKTTPDTGYEVDSVKINGTDATKDSENNYSFDLQTLSIPNSTLVVTFKVSQPTDECYLDLDSTTTDILEKKSLDQNYNLTVEETGYADATKVKLSWEIKDINATRTDNKVWDTENLCWKTSSSTKIDQKGSAKFTLENYSSVEVDATAKFEALSDTGVTVAFDEATGTDGTITLDTANGSETYSKTNVPKGEITVTVTPSADYFKDKTATTTAAKYGTYTVTIEEHEVPACIASGAMVTLADGTKKVIDDVTMNDRLLTYNFFTGEIEGNKPLYIMKNDNILSSVITLSFSDGSELEMCDEQSFFDMEARDYMLISRKNYQDAIGKKIMQIKDGKIETVTITDITLEKRYCTSYELATENAVNFVTNDIVNTPPEYFLPGAYTVGENMKIDAEQYNKDAAKYGLYTYADFEKYISENTFITGHIADLKIAVGKGLISEEDLFAGYEEWIPVIHDTNK